MPTSVRTGHVATVHGYDVFQDSPYGDAWFALPVDPALAAGEDAPVTYPSLAALLRDIQATYRAPAAST